MKHRLDSRVHPRVAPGAGRRLGGSAIASPGMTDAVIPDAYGIGAWVRSGAEPVVSGLRRAPGTQAAPAAEQASAPLGPGTHPASACSLRIELRHGDRPLYVGTAFLVRSSHGHVLVTSRQNVTGRHEGSSEWIDARSRLEPDRIVVWHHRAGYPDQWRAQVQRIRARDGRPLWTEHPRHGSAVDVVALRLLERGWGMPEALALCPYDLTHQPSELGFSPADKVSVIGFPLDLQVSGFLPVWATGYIASEPALDIRGLPVVLIDCRTGRGQSGAPVIAPDPVHTSRLRLLGVYGGRVDASPGSGDIGCVWKTSALAELLAAVPLHYGEVAMLGASTQREAWLDYAADLSSD